MVARRYALCPIYSNQTHLPHHKLNRIPLVYRYECFAIVILLYNVSVVYRHI